MDGLRGVEVVLAVAPVLVAPAGPERRVEDGALRIGPVVAEAHLAGDRVDPDAADPRRRPGEVLVDEVLREAERLEDLRAVVALDRGDPHLGDDLHEPLVHRLDVALLGLLGGSPESIPCRTWSWIVSKARYGLIALAP